MVEDRSPILIGAGQVTQRDADPVSAKGPIDLMCEAARLASEDSGSGNGLLSSCDSLRVVKFLTGVYPDPLGLLAERLGADPPDKVLSATGGDSPQALVNSTAEALVNGRIEIALLCGGEALQSMPAAMLSGQTPGWVERDGAQLMAAPPSYEGTAAYEVPYGLQLPVNAYPLFENAIRAHHGWSLEEHRRKLGALCSRMTAVAAENPYAWFPKSYSAEEIAAPSADNRYVGFPYTKRMNAMICIDQAAALIMTTVGKAKELGVAESRWVYLHGCADAKDHWYLSERENFYSSPAIETAGRIALEIAGWNIGDIDHVDLYSCFPSAVQIGRDEWGIPENTSLPLTVTGGLPYAGGPVNNYVMHSIASMMNVLRAKPGSKGLCTAVGWYLTKHAAGLYSTEPIDRIWKREDPKTYQSEIDAGPKPTVAVEADGVGTVETYTVSHDREGPDKGIVVGRLEDDRRFLALTPKDDEIFRRMMSDEFIGTRGKVRPGKEGNVFEPE